MKGLLIIAIILLSTNSYAAKSKSECNIWLKKIDNIDSQARLKHSNRTSQRLRDQQGVDGYDFNELLYSLGFTNNTIIATKL